MDAIYYISSLLLVFVVVILPFVLLALIIKPHLLNNRISRTLSRGKILGVGVVSLFLATLMLSGVMAATEPASVRQEREQAALREKQAQEQQRAEQEKAKEAELAKPVISTTEDKQPVAFTTEEREDPNLPQGQTQVVQEGKNGEQTTTYEITTVKGVETARTVKSQVVTVEPVTRIVAVGTYVAPAPAPASSGDGYVNSAGNYIPSPSSNPSGATAQCADGTYSYSQSRRGTCSHHGGVAVWL